MNCSFPHFFMFPCSIFRGRSSVDISLSYLCQKHFSRFPFYGSLFSERTFAESKIRSFVVVLVHTAVALVYQSICRQILFRVKLLSHHSLSRYRSNWPTQTNILTIYISVIYPITCLTYLCTHVIRCVLINVSYHTSHLLHMYSEILHFAGFA